MSILHPDAGERVITAVSAFVFSFSDYEKRIANGRYRSMTILLPEKEKN